MLSSRGKISSKNNGQPSKRRILRTFLGICLTVFLILLIAAAYIWSHRYELVQNRVKRELETRGFQAELSIKEFSETEAQLNNVKLLHQGQTVLSADRLRVRYNWRELLDGKIKHVAITAPELRLNVDARGRPVDDWWPGRPKPADAGPGFEFPPDGIVIENGSVNINSPFGTFGSEIDARISSQTSFSAKLNVMESEFAYGDLSGRIRGPADLTFNGNDLEFQSDLILSEWQYKDFSGGEIRVDGAGNAQLSGEALTFRGEFEANSKRLDVGVVTMTALAGHWQGEIILPRSDSQTIEMRGDWRGRLDELVMPDAARRQGLADALTLRSALAETPIAEHFSRELSRGFEALIRSGDLEGRGRIEKSQNSTDIWLTDKLIWRGAKGEIIIRPRQKEMFYEFNRLNQELDLSFDAEFSYPRSLLLTGVDLEIESKTGRDLQAVRSFSGQVASRSTWHGTDKEGRAVRLAPFRVRSEYINEDRRRMKMSGSVDYDGSVPGGYAKGLIAKGDLYVVMGPKMQVRFVSWGNRPIQIDRFDTVTDWYAENVRFNMPGRREFFTRNARGHGRIKSPLSNIVTRLSRVDESQSMDLAIQNGLVDARLNPGEQLWDFSGGKTDMTSDNMPSPGTQMQADEFNLKAKLVPGEPAEFTVVSPRADVTTQLIAAHNLSVTAKGTPERMKVDYTGGTVEFLASEIPRLPMTGDVVYFNNQWAGEAVTELPGAADTPIDVAYKFEDGLGEAKVDIRNLRFRRSGLQPQALISALQGKIADVDGLVSAQIDLRFGTDMPLQSSGKAQIHNMNLGTLPGPLTGVQGDIGFSSFFPLKTDGLQKLTMSTF